MADSMFKKLLLSDISVESYKSIQDMKIDLNKGLNILIGKNGAGKSNFLEILYYTLIADELPSISNFKKIQYKLVNSTFTESFEVCFERKVSKIKADEDKVSVEIIRSVQAGNTLIVSNPEDISSEYQIFDRSKTKYKSIEVILNDKGYRFSEPIFLKYNLPSSLAFIAEAGKISADSKIRALWDAPETLSFLKKIFSRASVSLLFDFHENKIDGKFIDEYFVIDEGIIWALQQYTPIKDLRFNPNIVVYEDNTRTIIENVKIEFYINNNWYPWSVLSDGTKRLFYLVTEILANKDNIILLEEPELGIHPHQFHDLMTFIKEESENRQIIMSTHAPQALDHLKSDELSNIIIVHYNLNMGTQMRHLSDEEKQKAAAYVESTGYISDYWLHSDLEE